VFLILSPSTLLSLAQVAVQRATTVAAVLVATARLSRVNLLAAARLLNLR
jgi:hypothetical protein